MGQAFSHDDESEGVSFHQPLPEVVVVSRRTFLSHLRNRSFDSWEELVDALPDTAPQGSSETVVKCDPVDICTWVATFLIQSCMWGLVVYFADQSMVLGAFFSAVYTVFLWLCVDQLLPRNMAGKLWPNLPVAVGATGTLFLLCLQQDEENEISPLGVMCCCILPATIATLFWMRKLPEDPDRATLVTNLFLEIWAATIALRMMITGEESLSVASYSDFASLTCIGTIWVIISVLLYQYPSAWASVELVTWTLNVGVLGVGAGTAGLLATFAIQHHHWELMGWVPFSIINAVTGFLGFKMQRSFPVLLSALALAAVSMRASVFISDVTGNAVAGVCTFGLLGFAVIAAARAFDRSSQGFTAKGRQVEQTRQQTGA
mmetsp:Transcript_69903/g.166851  ORF Transcript_69903/g.166851 Transcript_69903/m.166851 type:complete len:375 (+) Transcript_69903:41-1165(+)